MTITATLTTLALLATGGVAAWQIHELHAGHGPVPAVGPDLRLTC
jgi:hypothetical protein